MSHQDSWELASCLLSCSWWWFDVILNSSSKPYLRLYSPTLAHYQTLMKGKISQEEKGADHGRSVLLYAFFLM